MAVGPRRYLEMGVDMALSLREHTALPVALATDEALSRVVEREYPRVFDEVRILPRRFRTGRAMKFGAAATSPWDETAFVDADCVVLGSLDGVFDALRHVPLAMLGERLTPADDRRHHGFSTRRLMETFKLDTYLKTNSGIFVFRHTDAEPLFEECLRAYRDEIRPAVRWQVFRGAFLGDEIAFGIVGGRLGVGVLPPPRPMYWGAEFHAIDPEGPDRPLLHFLAPLPEPLRSVVRTGLAARRARSGLPDRGLTHFDAEMARLAGSRWERLKGALGLAD